MQKAREEARIRKENKRKEEERRLKEEEEERLRVIKEVTLVKTWKKKKRQQKFQSIKVPLPCHRWWLNQQTIKLHEKQVSQGRRFISKFVGVVDMTVEGNRLGTTKVTVKIKSSRVIGNLDDVGGAAMIQYDTVDEAEQEAKEWEGPLVAAQDALSRWG